MDPLYFYIAEILAQYQECHLPGIGKFSLIYHPAQIKISDQLIEPPYQSILFNSSEEGSMENFILYITEREKISEFSANQRFEKFINQLKIKLSEGASIQIPWIGSLNRDPVENIHFQPAFSLKKGWTAIQAAVLLKEKIPADRPKQDKIRPHQEILVPPGSMEAGALSPWKLIWMLLGLVAIILLVFFLFKFTSPQNQYPSLPSRPLPELKKPGPSSASIVPLHPKPGLSAITSSTEVPVDSLKYYIVFASYGDSMHAVKQYQKLKNWGYTITLIPGPSRRHFHLAEFFDTPSKDSSLHLALVKKEFGRKAYISQDRGN
ncbi:MAG: HU domain-containing protein [Chitinophagaceae bacterium]